MDVLPANQRFSEIGSVSVELGGAASLSLTPPGGSDHQSLPALAVGAASGFALTPAGTRQRLRCAPSKRPAVQAVGLEAPGPCLVLPG